VAGERWDRPFLVVGLGAARDAAAEAFARAVLCGGRAPGSGEACGACGPCGRLAKGIHPDFHRLVPAKGRATIGVEQVEALQAALSLRPVEGRGNAVLVPDAEGLTPQAQNALLKTLEEPPPRTALVLTVVSPRALLTTVRSRCVSLRFPPVSPAEVRAAARRAGAGEEEAAALAVAAGGDPARLGEAAREGAGAAAPLFARAFAPRRGGRDPLGRNPLARDPLEGHEPAAAWVRGRGGALEEQRERLRMGLRILLALHAPAGGAPGGGLPGPGYNDLPAGARRARLAALGEARERVERNVDPAGILEALAVACRDADAVRD
jgi:DNA polymerase-3 subunit delta'